MTRQTVTCRHRGEHRLPTVPGIVPGSRDGAELAKAAAALWAGLAIAARLDEAPDGWAKSWDWLIAGDLATPWALLVQAGEPNDLLLLAKPGRTRERLLMVVVGAFCLAARPLSCAGCGGSFVPVIPPSCPEWWFSLR
jgi:hypothetical protein